MLIAAITDLPSTGMNPTPLLKKDQEESLAKQMKEMLENKTMEQ